MPRTCLIFSVQLSPSDLQQVRIALANIQVVQKIPLKSVNSLFPTAFLRLESIIQDLTEIVLQSKTKEFRFNAYILKMAIVKLEFVLSEIQLATDQTMLNIYNDLNKCHNVLKSLYTGIIESV